MWTNERVAEMTTILNNSYLESVLILVRSVKIAQNSAHVVYTLFLKVQMPKFKNSFVL